WLLKARGVNKSEISTFDWYGFGLKVNAPTILTLGVHSMRAGHAIEMSDGEIQINRFKRNEVF
ncbi:hypothetical protein EBR96_09225, partial [bacterium]|nr:hypothetical protein [bacterium]